jgi:hypothetical protein
MSRRVAHYKLCPNETGSGIALPQIQWAEAFVTVAETGSIRSAATVMHTSANAVRESIGKLEQHLGESLFERTPGGTRLTAQTKPAAVSRYRKFNGPRLS